MASKAVAAAPEAISEESAKTHRADRPTETQTVVDTTHADRTTVGNAPSVAGESQQDAEHISHAPTDDIRSQDVAAAPTPSSLEPNTEKRSEAVESNASGSQSLVPDTAISVTLSEPDKVAEAVLPSWTKFADLSIEEKFEQARLMDFEVRDAYLRERCRAAKMEVAHAASALDRATAIIETNLPFFLVHFEDMDAQGERSDLKGKVVGKTEWLRQNVPDLSRGTFYAALNAVKARYAEQERLMLGGEVPLAVQPGTRKAHLTETQKSVVEALVGQGFKNKDAILMVKAAVGQDFESLFKSALSPGLGHPPPPPDSPAPPVPADPAPAVVAEPLVRSDQSGEEKLDDEAESGGLPPRAVDPPVVELSVIGGEESAPEVDRQISAENAATLVLSAEASAVTTTSGTLSPTQTPENVPTPQPAAYADWESHQIPAPDFNLKYFAAASEDFKNRYRYAFQSGAFKKILEILKSKPDQVFANEHDFAQLGAALRGAAENANLLAAVITTALTPSPGPAREESKARRHDGLTNKAERASREPAPEAFPSTAAAPTPAKTSEGL